MDNMFRKIMSSDLGFASFTSTVAFVLTLVVELVVNKGLTFTLVMLTGLIFFVIFLALYGLLRFGSCALMSELCDEIEKK